MRLETRILVVDDDDAIRALLRTVLRRRGFVVETARNGIEALEQLGASRYALVVLDLMMPEMNGYDLLRNLEDQSFTARPRVLILTAGLNLQPVRSDLIVACLPKPFDIDLLVDTVTGCIGATAPLRQPDVAPDTTLPMPSRLN
ncbi:MAG TPA: response regulator [Thermoanaerobaculia bacterium]|nr:response regulator [Thermoanaerobaculia bacterium]